MKRRIISSLLALLLLAMPLTTSIYAASYQDQKEDLQEKVNEAQDKKEELESEKKDTLTQIEDLNSSIDDVEAELSKLSSEITDLEAKIKKKNSEIKKLEEEYEEKRQLLEDRLVAIYEEGQINFLDVLLSSESIWDYISMESRIRELTESDNKQMDEVEEKQKEVQKAKNQLEEDKTKLNTAKKSAQAKEQQLRVIKASKETKVSNLSEQEKKVQKQIEDYRKEIKDIDAKIRAQAQKASGVYSGSFSGTLGWPLSSNSTNYNVITSGFGPRSSPVAGASSNHRGIDIGVYIGTPVYASADGYVISVMQTGARGIFVLIKHADDLYTRYQHLSRAAVSEGAYVKRGQLIAYSGNTGVGSGPHLHFEVLTTPYYMSEINPLTCGLVSLPPLR